jgi:H+/Na+-translocating ferredoxin:NAD+ oxidoreductase subunit G
MPAEQTRNPASTPPSWPMYRALVGVGMFCGLLIVSVFVVTLPVILQNQAEALEQAVFQVLPGATSKRSLLLGEDGVFRVAQEGDPPPQTVHAGFNPEGELVGIAVQGQGMGYQDVIRVLYGYSPQVQAIVGMQVLASKETPGLGDKIEKDPAFIQNFVALDVSLGSAGRAPEHPIEYVKNGEKNQAWQIDGITGATISSKAIAQILRHSSEYWMPLIHSQREAFEQAGDTDEQP